MENMTLTFWEQFSRMGGAFVQNLSFLPWVLLLGGGLGLFMSLVRFYRVPFLSQLILLFVELIRGIPFLTIVFAVYFTLPLIGIELDAYETGVTVLSLTSAAFFSEIFRSGFMALDTGQFEAADSLGLAWIQKMRWIVLPQVFRVTLPSVIGQLVLTIKDTSIVSLVGVVDVVRMSRQVIQLTHAPFTAFAITAFWFAAVCYPLIWISVYLEKRFAVDER